VCAGRPHMPYEVEVSYSPFEPSPLRRSFLSSTAWLPDRLRDKEAVRS
jgi:hypothetical protein